MKYFSRRQWYSITSIVTVCILSFALFLFLQDNPNNGSGSQSPSPLVQGERVSSWGFPSALADGGVQEAKVYKEIQRLTTLIGNQEQEPTDYIVYVSIANQYRVLGDGQNVYQYLVKALDIDWEKTGLAWHNMGQLLKELGTLKSARAAFEHAIKAEPYIQQYHLSYIDFLRVYVPTDIKGIRRAEEAMLSVSGETTTVEE